MCAYSEELPPVVAHAGPEWEFKDETGGTKRKFGYISYTPDSELYLHVPLDDPDARAEATARVAALTNPTPAELEKALVGASMINLVYLLRCVGVRGMRRVLRVEALVILHVVNELGCDP